jgi:hypothetical protein
VVAALRGYPVARDTLAALLEPRATFRRGRIDMGSRASPNGTWRAADVEAGPEWARMATWGDVEKENPGVARFADRLWPGIVALGQGTAPPGGTPWFPIAYLATVRRDGAPRLHPFCPILAGGRLFAAIPRSSPKGSDLRRDPRCVIHAMPGPEDAELCLRADAAEVTDDIETMSLVQRVVSRSGVGGMIESVAHDPIFEFDLQQVDASVWVNVGQPGTHAVREQWRAA